MSGASGRVGLGRALAWGLHGQTAVQGEKAPGQKDGEGEEPAAGGARESGVGWSTPT